MQLRSSNKRTKGKKTEEKMGKIGRQTKRQKASSQNVGSVNRKHKWEDAVNSLNAVFDIDWLQIDNVKALQNQVTSCHDVPGLEKLTPVAVHQYLFLIRQVLENHEEIMKLRLIRTEFKKQLTSLEIQFRKICLAVVDYNKRHQDIAALRHVVAVIAAEVDQENLLVHERIVLNKTIELIRRVVCSKHPGIDFSGLTFESVAGFDDMKDDKIDVKLIRKEVRSSWVKTRKPGVKNMLDIVDKNTYQIKIHSHDMFADIIKQRKKIDRLIQIQALLEKRIGIVRAQLNEVIAAIGEDGLGDFMLYKTSAADMKVKMYSVKDLQLYYMDLMKEYVCKIQKVLHRMHPRIDFSYLGLKTIGSFEC